MFMIRMKKKNTTLKSRGFLLAEAIFSVFVTLIVVLILQNLLQSLKTANGADHHTDNIVFAYVQFNRFLQDDDTKYVYTLPSSSNFTKAAFVKVKKDGEKKTYNLSLYKNMVRSSTVNGGHMPLLLDVRAANFTTKDKQVKIDVTERDGRKSQLCFKLDPKPKEEKKNDKIKNKEKDSTKEESKDKKQNENDKRERITK
ncbi:ComGF family competence protein [Lactobacillus acetotolerans]|nr:ComGF family competence protein [Lactobacillus acetotolerans]